MHRQLHIQGKPITALNKPEMRIGTAPDNDIVLTGPGIAPLHAVLHDEHSMLWLERIAVGNMADIHVNGRRIVSRALLHEGDEMHIGTTAIKLSSARLPDVAAAGPVKAVHFSDRVVLRVLTGREAGKGYALVNSLCIGRSALSEIRLDDMAMAERQILVQRQGNDILVKNLSPVLEMRVSGWVCQEARLLPGAQFSIDQHRFQLQAPCSDMNDKPPLPPAEPVDISAPITGTVSAPAPRLFSKAQWILLAMAIALSGLFILLLFFSA